MASKAQIVLCLDRYVHEAFKRHAVNASKFRGVCEIAREIYWGTTNTVIRERALTVRWKAVQVDAELRKLKEFFEVPNPIGKRDRAPEELESITLERLEWFDYEEHMGMQSEDYKNHLRNRDPDKSFLEVLSDLSAVIEGSILQSKVSEAEYMATRMLSKIEEYQNHEASNRV